MYSVGHGARPADAFVVLLRDVGVRHLVDVRTKPGSRRHPWFGQSVLAETLGAAGVAYRWEPDLGGFREAAAGSPHTALAPDGFRGYADHMGTPAFARALAGLAQDGRRGPTAFMCAETRWTNCHRRFVADALTVEGWIVVHPIEPGVSEPHRLHPALRVQPDGGLVYDGGAADQGSFELA